MNQNLAFPVHPDPISGMHAWHQRVTLTTAHQGDQYGDVVVDTDKSTQVFEKWLEMTKPGPGPDGTRPPPMAGPPREAHRGSLPLLSRHGPRRITGPG